MILGQETNTWVGFNSMWFCSIVLKHELVFLYKRPADLIN